MLLQKLNKKNKDIGELRFRRAGFEHDLSHTHFSQPPDHPFVKM